MSPLPIEEHLDLLPDLRLSFLPGSTLPMMNQFGLECAEEAFHRCVVPAVPLTTHRWRHLELLHQILIAT